MQSIALPCLEGKVEQQKAPCDGFCYVPSYRTAAKWAAEFKDPARTFEAAS